MHAHATRCRSALSAVTLALATTAVHALPCEELRQTVEARIRAKGVTHFTVTIVDAAATHRGQVVGSCDLGSRKLMYMQGPGAAPAPATAQAASAAAPRAPMLTECADGRVITEGSCRK